MTIIENVSCDLLSNNPYSCNNSFLTRTLFLFIFLHSLHFCQPFAKLQQIVHLYSFVP